MKVKDLMSKQMFDMATKFDDTVYYDYKLKSTVVDCPFSKYMAIHTDVTDTDEELIIECGDVKKNKFTAWELHIDITKVQGYEDIANKDITSFIHKENSDTLVLLLQQFSITGNEDGVSSGTTGEANTILTLGNIVPKDVFNSMKSTANTIMMNIDGVFLNNDKTLAMFDEWFKNGPLDEEVESYRVTNYISDDIGHGYDKTAKGIEICFVRPMAKGSVIEVLFTISEEMLSDYDKFKDIPANKLLSTEECTFVSTFKGVSKDER